VASSLDIELASAGWSNGNFERRLRASALLDRLSFGGGWSVVGADQKSPFDTISAQPDAVIFMI
jgi:hypothetical protein